MLVELWPGKYILMEQDPQVSPGRYLDIANHAGNLSLSIPSSEMLK